MPGGAGSSPPDDEDDPGRPGIAGKSPLSPPGIPPEGIPPGIPSRPPVPDAPPAGPPRSPAAPAACGPGNHNRPVVRGRGGVHREGRGGGEQNGESRDRSHDGTATGPSPFGEPRAEQQRRDAHRGRDQDDVAQPRRPIRGSVQQRVGPHPGDGRHRDEQPARTLVLPGAPELRDHDPDESGDRRSQRHRVVLVEDAAHVAEHGDRDQQPAAPQQHRRPGAVGAGRTARQPQSGDERDQGRGQQPGDLACRSCR